jgi:S-adenosylmethionine-diacylglycerol 3-amino-3-carboxypropyl transferase
MKAPYNYGLSQEDALTELKALDVQPDDRLLCIASGGEVPLNLLALRRIRIDAADVSPGQLFLSRLKLGACRALEPREAAAFLGFSDATAVERKRLFGQVRRFLREEDKGYWTANLPAIETGAVRAGRFERYLEKLRSVGLFVLGKRKLIRLFELDSGPERRDFFDRFLSTPFLKALFRAAFHPRLYRKRGIASQGLIHCGAGGPAAFFHRRFRDFCTATPPRNNYYHLWSLFGRVLFPEALPEYLSEKGMQRVRQRPDAVSWRFASFQDVLRSSVPGTFNKFHLSNIGDWMSLGSLYPSQSPGPRGPAGAAGLR